MAKKKDKQQKKLGPPKAEFSESSQADLFPVKNPAENSCMEFATTPSATPVGESDAKENAENTDIADMCSDLVNEPFFVDEENDAADALNLWAEATTSAEISMVISSDRLATDVSHQENETSDQAIETSDQATETSDKDTDTSEELPVIKPVEVTMTSSSNNLAVIASENEVVEIPSDKELAIASASNVPLFYSDDDDVANQVTAQDVNEIVTEQGGVSDLVAQQLKQMFEEGGATATCASAGSFTGTHSMNLNVKAGAVDMNLSTVTEANQELVELKAQIELQQRLLAESQVRLDAANQRIGYLEAEIAQKNKILDEKLEQSSWLRSLFGL